ncbi:hypothetical protein PCE1_004703 [Barthelona sp. PCE]
MDRVRVEELYLFVLHYDPDTFVSIMRKKLCLYDLGVYKQYFLELDVYYDLVREYFTSSNCSVTHTAEIFKDFKVIDIFREVYMEIYEKNQEEWQNSSIQSLSILHPIIETDIEEVMFAGHVLPCDKLTRRIFEEFVKRSCGIFHIDQILWLINRFALWGGDLHLKCVQVAIDLLKRKYSAKAIERDFILSHNNLLLISIIDHVDDVIELFNSMSFVFADNNEIAHVLFSTRTWFNVLNNICMYNTSIPEPLLDTASNYLYKMLQFYSQYESLTYVLSHICVHNILPKIYCHFNPEVFMKKKKFLDVSQDLIKIMNRKNKEISLKTNISPLFWVRIIKPIFEQDMTPTTQLMLSKFLHAFCTAIPLDPVQDFDENKIICPNMEFFDKYGLNDLLKHIGGSLSLNLPDDEYIKVAGKTLSLDSDFKKHRLFKPNVKLYAENINCHPEITEKTLEDYSKEINHDPLVILYQEQLESLRDELLDELDERLLVLSQIVTLQIEVLNTLEMGSDSTLQSKLDEVIVQVPHITKYFKKLNTLVNYFEIEMTEIQLENAKNAMKLQRGFPEYLTEAIILMISTFSHNFELMLFSLQNNGTSPYAMKALDHMLQSFNVDNAIKFVDELSNIFESYNFIGVTATKMILSLIRSIAMNFSSVNVDGFIEILWQKKISVDVRIVLVSVTIEKFISTIENGNLDEFGMFTILKDAAERYITSPEILKQLGNLINLVKAKLSTDKWLSVYPIIEKAIVLPILCFEVPDDAKKKTDIDKKGILNVIRSYCTSIIREDPSIMSEELALWFTSNIKTLYETYDSYLDTAVLITYFRLGHDAAELWANKLYEICDDEWEMHLRLDAPFECRRYKKSPFVFSTEVVDSVDFFRFATKHYVSLLQFFNFHPTTLFTYLNVLDYNIVERIEYFINIPTRFACVCADDVFIGLNTILYQELLEACELLDNAGCFNEYLISMLKVMCRDLTNGCDLIKQLHEEMPLFYSECLKFDPQLLTYVFSCVENGQHVNPKKKLRSRGGVMGKIGKQKRKICYLPGSERASKHMGKKKKSMLGKKKSMLGKKKSRLGKKMKKTSSTIPLNTFNVNYARKMKKVAKTNTTSSFTF